MHKIKRLDNILSEKLKVLRNRPSLRKIHYFLSQDKELWVFIAGNLLTDTNLGTDQVLQANKKLNKIKSLVWILHGKSVHYKYRIIAKIFIFK